MEIQRKAYQRLLQWKKESNGETAMLLEGARRVGKSYLAQQFAKQEYESYLYVDFTYGTKMSIINIFSSIVYAEKVADCYIKELVYGSVDFVSNVGHIFDVRSLYEINTLIQSASNIPNVNMKHIFDLFEE